jgi:signal transduction histidine kinase
MQLINALLLVSFLIGLSIGIFILYRHGKNKGYLLLAGALITASFWALSILGGILTGNMIIANSSFSFAVLILGFLILSIAELARLLSKNIRLTISFISIATAISVYLPNAVAQKISVEAGYIRLDEPGYLYNFFLAYFAVYAVFLIVLARIAIKKTVGTKKRQLIYISSGFILSLIAGITFNLALPSFGIFQFNGLGPVFMLIMSTFAIYTATRHYLYEPRVILAELYAVLLILISITRLVMFPDAINYIICGLTVGLSLLFIRSTIDGADRNLELKRDKTELVRLDRMKDEFLMMATHELNTPITILQGKMEMIVNEKFGDFSKEQKEYFNPILDNFKKLSLMFKHILEVVNIDEHRFEIRKSPLDLRLLVEKAIETTESAHNEKYEIILNAPAKIWVDGDEEKLREVFLQLLDNGIKFSCIDNNEGILKVNIKSDKDNVIISVSDNGIGISKTDQKHITEKFFQSKRFDENMPTEQQGAGLALYISRKITELHHGRMWFESEEGKGTTFFVSLPI